MIIGIAKIAITPVTTTENKVDFLSSMFSGLNNVITLLNYLNLNTTGSNFEWTMNELELFVFESKIQEFQKKFYH